MDKFDQLYMQQSPIKMDSSHSSINHQKVLKFLQCDESVPSDSDDENWETTSESESDDTLYDLPRRQRRSDLNIKLVSVGTLTEDEDLHEDYQKEEILVDDGKLEWDDEDLYLREQFDIVVVPDPYWFIKRSTRFLSYLLFGYILYLLVWRHVPAELDF